MKPSAADKKKLHLHLHRLLSELPDAYYYVASEPPALDHSGREDVPDFVVICRDYGLLVVAIRDWVELRAGNQGELHIVRQDGTEAVEPNPFDMVTRYAYQIVQQYMRRSELTRRYHNKTRLSFPWQVMVVLPNIPYERIKDFERVGIWSGRAVLGHEMLQSSRRLEQAIRNLPWRWELEEHLDDVTFNTMRGVINPQLVITDTAGNDLGTQTVEQEKLIHEPHHARLDGDEAADDNELIELPDPLSSEARKVVQDMQVRLIRGTAGSGKTLVLANRAEFLARSYPDQRMLVITFNRDLADVLKNRLDEAGIEVKTYNEICYSVLHEIGKWVAPIEVTTWLETSARSEIVESGLSLEYIRQEIRWRKEMKLYEDDRYLRVDRKGRRRPLSRDKRLLINTIFNRYITYQNGLRAQGKSWQDWDDLHSLAAAEIQSSRHALREWYDVILIDEAQDFAPSWFGLIH
ncbi:MAG TPA: UvrD-helicase domain-containing protein, partial [Phototrophicaceae bacterium]|nr:UvrD-helicase domain-containing protein [Phototrophicaceae bacterium]